MLKAKSKKSFSLATAAMALVLAAAAYATVTSVPDAVRNAIKRCESSGRYSVVNQYGYAGAYQFSKSHVNTCLTNGICAKYGVTTREQFLNSKEAQDAYFDWYAVGVVNANEANWSQYVGKTLPGTNTTITLWGIFMGAHLLGPAGITSTLKSVFSGGSSGADANGMQGTTYINIGSLLDLNTTGPDPAGSSCKNTSVAGFINGSGGNFGEAGSGGTGDGGAGTGGNTNRFQVENLPWYTGGDDTLSDARYKELFEDDSCN